MRDLPSDLLLQQAASLHQSGRVADAIPLYKQVLRKDPKAVAALNLLGLAQFQLGQLPQAAVSLKRAAKADPNIPNIDFNLGRVLQAQNELVDALIHYEKAVAKAPNDAEALSNLGTVLGALGRTADAISAYEKATAINPAYVDAWFNLGNAYHAEKRLAQAVTAYEKALALKADHALSCGALGLTLNLLDRQDDAIKFSRQAIALDPTNVSYRINLANALTVIGDDKAAHQSYDDALRLDPQSADALWNKGLLYLSRGQFADGWPYFAQRWIVRRAAQRRKYRAPSWSGGKVDGSLLVWGEQGIGDQILFSSMVPDLRRYSDSIILEVEPRLVKLLARSLPDVTVIAQEKKLYGERIAAQAALGDLGQFLRPDAGSFQSAAQGYLKPDSERAAGLRRRLAGDGRHVIGLSWLSVNRDLGLSKSAKLADLPPLLQLPDCRFIDLQYGDTSAERANLERQTGLRVERIDDIDNTADIDGLVALMAACDAVVTVSNTTAHLAAAQGRPTWVLLSHGCGLLWYWMKEGATPFYAQARLCRQQKGQPWEDLVRQVTPDVAGYLGSPEREA